MYPITFSVSTRKLQNNPFEPIPLVTAPGLHVESLPSTPGTVILPHRCVYREFLGDRWW